TPQSRNEVANSLHDQSRQGCRDIEGSRLIPPSMTAMNDALRILEDSLRGAPIIWKGDYPYFIHPISDGIPRMDPEVLKAATELIVGTTDWEGVDLIVSVEAMGLPLLASVGNATGIPTVVIRKRSYGMDGEISVDVSTGYSSSTIFINDIFPGERIVIVDDVISTGGTLEPLLKKLEDMGVILHDVVIAIEKGDGRERLNRERPDWPVRSLARIEIVEGKVEISE
ncbi:MAG: hypoxanthine/guanine phosphoribosyltransferase, partial [Candidatus Thermoplasmatota archaeon]|nr:hypoxanthine/guanine phosphoribosyltransferase [Candidatus Thermoplasmatota archaeon]